MVKGEIRGPVLNFEGEGSGSIGANIYRIEVGWVRYIYGTWGGVEWDPRRGPGGLGMVPTSRPPPLFKGGGAPQCRVRVR